MFSEILSSVMSKFDSSHAQCSHFYSAVNISSTSVVALHDSSQLLCAKSNSKSTPLALSGQMPSYFIYAAELLHPLVSHSRRAISLIAFPFLVSQISFLFFFLFFLIAAFPFNLIRRNSCDIIRHPLRLHLCQLQMQLWDCAGWNGRRQLHDRQGCYSKIRLESEVLSVSVNQGAAKWLKPSISAPSEGSEILLHDS